MHEEAFSFQSLLLVTVLAAAVPLILRRFRRLRLPVVVGEILAGLVVGKSGLGLVEEDLWLAFLSTLGFAYLMFLSGLEVDFEAVTEQFRQLLQARSGGQDHLAEHPIILSSLIFLLTLVASVGCALVLSWVGWVSSPWFMALILSTISLGVIVPVLKERRLLPTAYGQVILLVATIADFATMLLISLYAALVTRGLTLDVLLVLILLGAFLTLFRMVRLLRQRVPQPLVHLDEWLSAQTAQMPIRVAFALGMAFIALAEVLGIEVILGAFLGGAIISLLSPEEGSELREKLDAFGYGFFIPIFFIHVGTQLDIRTLAESPAAVALVPMLTLVAFAVKIVPALLFRFTYNWRETLGAGLLLSAQLSLTIAAAEIGVDLGLFTPAMEAAVVVMAAATCILSPLLFEQIVPRPAPTRRYGVVIVGADELGLSLAQRLSTHDEPVTVVDVSLERCHKAEAIGIRVICGDARHSEVLSSANLAEARVLVCVLRDVELAQEVCRLAQEEFQPPTAVAWLQNPEDRPAFQRLGVRTVIPALTSLEVLENVVRYPDAFLFLSDLEEEGEREVREIILEQKCWEGQPLREMPLPTEVLVLALRRGNELIVPRGSTILRRGDIMTLMGQPAAVEQTRRLCEEILS